MTGIQPDVYTPQEWQDILVNARKAYHQNPNDHEALQAMKDATAALNLNDHSGDDAQTGDRGILGAVGGIARGIADIPQGMYNLARHPIKSLGQMSGVSNIPNAVHTIFNDDEANWAEKLASAVQATPLNMGYAPQRAFQDAMSNPATSSFDRARAGTNAASQALLAFGGRKAPPKLGASQFGGPPVEVMPSGTPQPLRPPMPEPTPPIGAEQFGGPSVQAAPPGPPRPPLPEMPMAPPTATLEPMPVGDMSFTPRQKSTPTADPTLTPASSGEVPKFTNPEVLPDAGVNAIGQPRGISVEGPPMKPVTPAMEAFGETRSGIPRTKPRGSGGVKQKSVTFGEESPLNAGSRGKVKGILGEMSREPGSMGELMDGLGKGNVQGMLGFSIGPFLAWEIMRRTVRPLIDRIAEHGVNPQAAMEAIKNNPHLAALESALVKAYAAGNTQQVNQLSQELATQLMMQMPQQEQ